MQPIDYKTARSVVETILRSDKPEKNRRESLLNELGLTCSDPQLKFFDYYNEASYLSIVDEKKWLLAKIKYGF